ncbi:MAG TPA: iron ABC transporter permease [Spirochaetota bacterium]|nr:iron ABC transporter permease [Spirochaetota bacterium]
MSKKKILISIILIAAPLICIFSSAFLGRYPLSPSEIYQAVMHKLTGAGFVPSVNSNIVWEIRLPRAILGSMVGAALAVSGTALQGMFRNPLVSSGMLGVSSGAGFGAALAIILFHNTLMIYLFAFIFGILAVICSYIIGRIYDTAPAIMLVLGGVIVSSIFSALLSLMKYIADPQDDLPSIVFWLMGSLASATYKDIIISAIPIFIGITGLVIMRWRLNVLSMGEREALSMGLNVNLDRAIIITCTTLATAGAVSVSGIIGWIGLVIPHIGRIIAGNDNRILIPASISLGACFLILIDNLGRVITGAELPLSILTAIIGGPFFVYLLKRTKGGNW